MDTVRFFAANTQPNPVEVDYWVDLYDNPYGGSIKYYNGTEWVRLAASGGIPDLSKYYTKVQVNQLLNDKASVQSVESKVDDEEVKDVIKNITFRTSNPNEVQMVLAKYDTTTVAISLPKASDVSAGIVTSDDFKDFVKQVDFQQLYQELYDSNSNIMNAINDIKAKYQKKLIAGSNIKISDDNVISATTSIEGGDIDVDGINSKIDELTGKLQEEVTRSTNADNKLTRDLSTESTTARAAEKKNADNIASNTQAIQKEVTDRNAAIKVETDRATAAENKLANDIVTTVETEKDRAEGVEQVIINDLAEEVTRAKAAEQANKTSINKEVTDRQSAIATEVDNRNAAIEVEKQRALKAEAALDSKIATHTNEINTALATKADKSTTYNKTEVDSKVSTINQTKQDKLTAGSGIKIENNTISSTLDVQLYKIVDSLPTQDVEPGKIYLVLSETSTESNKYTEYVYVNNEWEIIGSYTANVDLSGYLTKTDAASTYQPKGNYALKTEIPDVSTKADTSYVNTQIQTVNTEINKKANKADLHAVATSGNYNDLTNKLKAGSGVTITDDNTINTSVDLSGVTNSISELDSKIEAEISRATIAESNKVDKIVGKGLSTNDYTTNEKNKLAGIASGAEVNVQSDWNQIDINSDDYIKNKPVAATTSKDGFMSASDKTKLDGIAQGANAYTLPAATTQVLGGVKIGNNISLADGGVISINKTNVTTALGYTPLESVDTSNFVTLNNNQTITGIKTFTRTIKTNSNIWSDSKDFVIINQLSDTSTPKISFRVANSDGAVTYCAQVADFSNNNNRNLGNVANKWGTLYVNKVESSTIVNSGLISSNSFQSNVPTGTAPFNCVSTTVNPNLNAGLFNGASIINNNFIYLTKQELKFTYNESAQYIYAKITHNNKYLSEQLNIKIETDYQNVSGKTYLYRDGFSNRYRVYITEHNNSNVKGISTANINGQSITYLKLSNNDGANIKVFSNYHFNIEEITDVSDVTFTNVASGIYVSYPVQFTVPIIADIKGNSSTSTKLQTARQINGTDFDGTGNITTSKWGISRNLTIGKTTKAVDGSANVNYTVEDIGLSKLTLSIGDSITEYDGTADKTIEIPSGGGIDALPVNTILRSTAEAGNVFGEGWLPCDGSTVSSKDYPLLNCQKVVIPTKAYKGTDGKTFAKQLGYSDVYNDILCVTTTSNSYNDVVLAKTSEVIYRIQSSVNVTTVYDYYLIYRNYFIFGGTNDSDIYIVNLKDGKNTTTRISAGAVCRGIFNIDDKIIVFTSAAIRSLDLQTNSLTNVVKRPVGSVLVHFPYDNSFLYSGSGANGMYLSSYDAEPIETHIPYAEVGKELITKGKLGIAYNNNAANTIYIIKNPSDDTSKWQKVNVTDDATRCIYTNDIFLHIASEGTNQTQDFVNWYQTSNDFSANSQNFSLDAPIMKGPENILYYCGNSYVVEATINNVLPVLENRYIKTYIGQSQEYVGKLTINMISNQSTSDASLVGTIVKVYDNTMSLIDERTWQGLAYTLDVLPNIEYTIVATSTNGVSQDPVTVTLTNNEVKTVTITYNFEKLVIQAYEKEQISTRATITVKYNDKVLATSSNGKLTAYIAYGTVYVITYGDLEELVKPKDVEYTASQTTREINAVYDDYKPDYITIDQTITDPNTMISGDVNGATLQWIRNNTHRYISKNTGDGQVTICQLSDDDTAKFYDGITDSTIYIEDTDYNVFVRIPRFWYKAIETTTDVWKIGFSKKQQDGTWKEWDGNDLIGAYEAYFNNLHLYSVSNKASSGDISQSALTSHARNNGTGYTLVKWKHHCIVGVLYYALYGNTNCQATIGSGTNSYTKNTGTTNSLGMHDTSASGTGNSNSINFLGLENWWGNKYEFIDNVVFNKSSASYKYTISEDDGSTREIETTTSTSQQYPKVMVFGENLDLAMKRGTSSASTTTGFCDGQYISSSTDRVVRRSCSNSYADGGVAYLGASDSASGASSGFGSRLAFRGTIIEEKNIETFKAL